MNLFAHVCTVCDMYVILCFFWKVYSWIWRQWHGPPGGAVFQNFTQPQAWRSNTTCLGGVDPAGSLWNHLQLNTLLRVIPSLTNLLDILSHILSGIYSDILSHVEKRVKISASLATTSTAISDLQRRRWPLYERVCASQSAWCNGWAKNISHSFWHSIWHLFCHSFWHFFWHYVWHMFWHLIWKPFWRSIWHVFGSALHSIAGGIAFGSRQWGAAPLSKSTLGRSGNKTKHEATRAKERIHINHSIYIDLKDSLRFNQLST